MTQEPKIKPSPEVIARLLRTDDLFKPTRAERTARMPSALRVASTALSILATALLGFAVYLGFVSGLHHDRSQFTSYADFRSDLAKGIAPVGPSNPGTPMALLEIPKIGLKEVVFEGTSSSVLEGGPGHMRSTVLPGQAGTSVLMGRSTMYSGPFGRIATLAPDDTITITTGQGVNSFKVLGVRRAYDAQPPPLPGGYGRLTLVTADGNPFVASDIVRVDADLTTATQPRPRILIAAADLRSAAELPMGSENLAWFPLIAVGIAMAVAACVTGWIRYAWGAPQTWLVAVPVLVALGIAASDQAVRLLPNLI